MIKVIMEFCNIMIDISKLNWHDIDFFDDIPNEVFFWIRDDQSLTQKLKKKFCDFKVDVKKQEESSLYDHELLRLDKANKFIVREVFLCGNKKPVVFARSAIPIVTETKPIINLGSRPLGEILFTNSNINREPIEVTFHKNIWGRRSVFTSRGARILISEFFLKELFID